MSSSQDTDDSDGTPSSSSHLPQQEKSSSSQMLLNAFDNMVSLVLQDTFLDPKKFLSCFDSIFLDKPLFKQETGPLLDDQQKVLVRSWLLNVLPNLVVKWREAMYSSFSAHLIRHKIPLLLNRMDVFVQYATLLKEQSQKNKDLFSTPLPSFPSEFQKSTWEHLVSNLPILLEKNSDDDDDTETEQSSSSTIKSQLYNALLLAAAQVLEDPLGALEHSNSLSSKKQQVKSKMNSASLEAKQNYLKSLDQEIHDIRISNNAKLSQLKKKKKFILKTESDISSILVTLASFSGSDISKNTNDLNETLASILSYRDHISNQPLQ